MSQWFSPNPSEWRLFFLGIAAMNSCSPGMGIFRNFVSWASFSRISFSSDRSVRFSLKRVRIRSSSNVLFRSRTSTFFCRVWFRFFSVSSCEVLLLGCLTFYKTTILWSVCNNNNFRHELHPLHPGRRSRALLSTDGMQKNRIWNLENRKTTFYEEDFEGNGVRRTMATLCLLSFRNTCFFLFQVENGDHSRRLSGFIQLNSSQTQRL